MTVIEMFDGALLMKSAVAKNELRSFQNDNMKAKIMKKMVDKIDLDRMARTFTIES